LKHCKIFTFSTVTANFDTSLAKCTIVDGFLARPTSSIEFDDVKFISNNLNTNFWLGGAFFSVANLYSETNEYGWVTSGTGDRMGILRNEWYNIISD
jgi:hypothetical protein